MPIVALDHVQLAMPPGEEAKARFVPMVLGVGRPLFKPGAQRTRMELLESRALKSGGVVLRYRTRSTT